MTVLIIKLMRTYGNRGFLFLNLREEFFHSKVIVLLLFCWMFTLFYRRLIHILLLLSNYTVLYVSWGFWVVVFLLSQNFTRSLHLSVKSFLLFTVIRVCLFRALMINNPFVFSFIDTPWWSVDDLIDTIKKILCLLLFTVFLHLFNLVNI